MSGHSKWSNIKRKKEKTDAQKAKIFTKIGREITVCVREGGADPASNGKLRDLIAKAKSLNVPNDNINRIIKKAQGDNKEDYESILYEGYGPQGIAFMVESLTDSRNRTAANLRHYFDKYGGNLGQSGCVSFMFEPKGVIIIEPDGIDVEKLMEDSLDLEIEDFNAEDTIIEITTHPNTLQAITQKLQEQGYLIASSEVIQIPSTTIELTSEEDIKKMNLLVQHLEEDDDVQNIWHNLENIDILD